LINKNKVEEKLKLKKKMELRMGEKVIISKKKKKTLITKMEVNWKEKMGNIKNKKKKKKIKNKKELIII
jgi:hypothetical protein